MSTKSLKRAKKILTNARIGLIMVSTTQGMEVNTMTATTIGNADSLMKEILSVPEPKRTECINMMRCMLLGVRVAEQSHTGDWREGA